MTKLVRRICSWAVIAVALSGGVRAAFAQAGMPSPGMRPPRQAAPKQPTRPDQPVTHAASGASDESMRLGGTEPTLPADPLEIPPEVKGQIGTDAEREGEVGRLPRTHRLLIPPYYSERSGSYGFKTVFPLWMERKQPNDRASLFGGIYYNRRSTKHDADVLFPLFWHMRDDKTYTTVVGPYMHREAPMEHDNWLAPLFFSGSRAKGSYFHMPLLLTFTSHTDKGGFNMIGPYYCSWRGGSSCSPKRAESIDYGVPPLFFAGKSETSRYEFVPLPLPHYFHYNELSDSSINVWGPLVWQHDRESESFDVIPFFWHKWGKNSDHVTVFPFFHYGYSGNSNLLVNPLFLSARGENGESTFITWLYARYRGRTKLDVITPFYWHYEDPDIGQRSTVVAPFVYTMTSPRGYDTGVFPFYLHIKRPQLSETTWVTPLFQHTTDTQGWLTNVYPFVYLGRTNESTHTVVAPFLWDFASPHSRTTVVFPVYWRFADDNSFTQLLGNTYYRERRIGGALDWEFHFFPAFSYGETPDGHWWNVLFGLAGYTRRGAMSQARAFWVPITLSESIPIE